MPQLTSCVTLALVLTTVAGCGGSTSSESGTSPTDVDTPSSSSTVTESKMLKQAMIDATAKFMKENQPDMDLEAIRTQVETGIAQVRKDVPNFLMLSGEDERKLETGMRVSGAVKRIADAEAFLNEFGVPPSGLVEFLLPTYKEGFLSPTDVELLAQMIDANMKKAEHALSN